MGREALRIKTPLEVIQDLIDNASIATESEFLRTATSWLASFGTRVFQVETGLLIARRHIGDRYEPAQARLEELKLRVSRLMIEHGSDWVPDDKLRHELFTGLDVLSEAKRKVRP